MGAPLAKRTLLSFGPPPLPPPSPGSALSVITTVPKSTCQIHWSLAQRAVVPACRWHVILLASSVVKLSLSLASAMPTLSWHLLPVSWPFLPSLLAVSLLCPPLRGWHFLALCPWSSPLLTWYYPWGCPLCPQPTPLLPLLT